MLIDGWRVGGTGNAYVSLNGSTVDAFDGTQYLLMHVPGRSISQVVNMQVGRQYRFDFHIYNYHNQFPLPVSQVDIVSEYPADTLVNSRVLFNPAFTAIWVQPGIPGPRFQWQEFSGIFTAQSDQERLSIQLSGWNAFVDGVSLVEVPEPGAVVLSIIGLLFWRWDICRYARRNNCSL